jgi:hypothetical protein
MRLTSGLDKVEQDMDAVVPESRVTLDSALLGQNVIVLSLEVARDFTKGRLVVNAVTETRSVHDGQRDTGSFLIQLELHSHRLDLDTLLEMRSGRIISVQRCEDLAVAESVDKGCAAGTRGTADHQTELNSLLDILLAAKLDGGGRGRHAAWRVGAHEIYPVRSFS